MHTAVAGVACAISVLPFWWGTAQKHSTDITTSVTSKGVHKALRRSGSTNTKETTALAFKSSFFCRCHRGQTTTNNSSADSVLTTAAVACAIRTLPFHRAWGTTSTQAYANITKCRGYPYSTDSIKSASRKKLCQLSVGKSPFGDVSNTRHASIPAMRKVVTGVACMIKVLPFHRALNSILKNKHHLTARATERVKWSSAEAVWSTSTQVWLSSSPKQKNIDLAARAVATWQAQTTMPMHFTCRCKGKEGP